MSNLKAFLAENAIKADTVAYEASKRFVGEDKKPMLWELEALDSDNYDKLLARCKTKSPDPSNPRQSLITADPTKVRDALLVACVKFPNLADTELQNSYNVVGELEVLKKMLSPGELTDLFLTIQQLHGFEVGMGEKIEQAKN